MSKESRYILVEKLARGGMAEIYLGCTSSEDGFRRVCCIKRILPHFSQEKEYIEMFRDEAHICKRLQHANIVRVEGFEEVENSYAIIMEFVDGADLRKILVACENSGIALPIPIALYIAAEIARGLHYAHRKIDDITRKELKIVHRDISPQNILVSFEGEAKITDFGIADADNKSTETKPGIVKGKYSYMSPEQIMAKQVDSRTDVFALAIVLWEMVSMERLFHGENDVITIQKVKNCEIKRIPRGKKRKNAEIDDELEAIILSGLQKDVRKRFQSGKAFEAAIRKYLNKNYPSFGPENLSEFMKDLLSSERKNSEAAIKRALTAEDSNPKNAKVPVRILGSQISQASHPSQSSHGVDFELADAKSTQDFTIARKKSRSVGVASPVSLAHPHTRTQSRTQSPGNSRSKINQSSLESINGGSLRRKLTNAPPATGMKAQHTLPYYPKKSNSRFFFMVVASILSLGIISVAAKRFFQSRKNPTVLQLTTVPSNVKITIDGVPLENGRYIQTPIKEKIRQGNHKLLVTRDGFQDEKINLAISAGARVKKFVVALKKNQRFAPIRVRVGNPGVEKVWVSIDQGLDTGYAPRKIPDITAGRQHEIRVYPNYPKRKDWFSCNFKPRSRSWRAPYVIVVYPKDKKCTFSNP